MSQKRLKWITAMISVGLCLGLLTVLEWGCRKLARKSAPAYATTFLSGSLSSDGINNQTVLGPEKTPHGIFPQVPTEFHTNPTYPAPRGYRPELLLPTRFDPNPFGNYGSLPFFLPVRSARSWRLMKRGTKVIDYHFEIDSFARRWTPDTSQTNSSRQYLIFLGCSFVFGEGVSDQETLPSFASRYSNHFHSYNYGIMGASPGDSYLRLREIRKEQELAEKSGWVIYVYMDHHLPRLVGPLSMLTTWAGHKNHYVIDPNGEIRTDGHFDELVPHQIAVYKTLRKSSFFRWLKIDWPPRAHESDWELMAKIFTAMKKTAKERLQARHFAVLIFPGSETARHLIPYLEKQGIAYLDYSHWDMNMLTHGNPWFPYDKHPTPATYELIAKSLVLELDKIDRQGLASGF
jgi:hypothetical protein